MADQSRRTPEPSPLTDFNEGSNISSPLKPLGLPVAGHNAEELAQRAIPRVMREISTDGMWNLLEKTEADMDKAFRNLPTLASCQNNLPKTPSKPSPEFVYTVFLNLISDKVHDKLGAEKEKKIYFFDRHSYAAKDHPTGTINRPDFLARRDEDKPALKFHWSALEATGELLSGKNREHSHIKTVSYTSFLLQARPDKLTVQGINVESKGFRLIVSNACGSFSTELLDWSSRDFRLLLCAWIWRLYRPVVDPSITITIKGDKRPTFKIVLPGNGGVYNDCEILTVGSAFGRRTTIFQCPEKPNIILKEQFIETRRRFKEASILTQIHERGTFPGVVRLGWSGLEEKEEELVVQWEDPKTSKISKRKKTRLVLLDKGVSIMDAKTLLQALVAIYDVLENTEVAPANTLPGDGAPLPGAVPANTSIAKELQDTCFASHLLKTKSNDQKSVSSSGVLASAHFYSVGRLDTNVLLIDFDMGEAQQNDNPDKKGPHSQTGTPIFMARTVVSATKKRGKYNLEPMPQLEPHQAHEIYEAAVPTRLANFPPNERAFSEIRADKKLKPFGHKLQYDAESNFWLLFWWAIHALPADDPTHKEIHHNHWGNLTGGDDKNDSRVRFIPNFPDNILHPVYEPLEWLLRDMSEQLWGYHEEGQDPSRKKDEYLHEAFQRLIFKFLFTHYDESFMNVEKSRESRKPATVDAMKPPLAANEIKRARARSSAASRPVDSSFSRTLRSDLKWKGVSPDEDHRDEDYDPSGSQRKRVRT